MIIEDEFNAEELMERLCGGLYEATKNNDAQTLRRVALLINILNNIKEVIWSSDDDKVMLASMKHKVFAPLGDEDEA